MPVFCRRNVGFLCGIITALAASPPVAAVDPRQEFLQEYEPHAVAGLEHYKNVRYRIRREAPSGPSRMQVTICTGTCNRDHYIFTGETRFIERATGNVASTSRDTVEVSNPQYSFTVHDRGPDGWLLKEFRLRAEAPGESMTCDLLFPFVETTWGRTYLDIFRDPETNVLNTRAVVWRDRTVREVAYEVSFYHRGEKKIVRRPIVSYFDPAARWVCVGSGAIGIPGSTDTGEQVHTYEVRDGWPVPVRDEYWLVPAGQSGSGTRLRATEIEEYVPIPKLDEAQYRLSAFGLPEPAGVVWSKPTPNYVWFLIAAVGCGLLAVMFRWLARRHRARTVPTPESSSIP